MPSILPGGDPFLEPAERLSARRALLRLLTRHPNQVVTHADVEDEAGRYFSKWSVRRAVASLRCDIAVRFKRRDGGGYALLVPVRDADQTQKCADCSHHTILNHCRELDRDTDQSDWCLGWTP